MSLADDIKTIAELGVHNSGKLPPATLVALGNVLEAARQRDELGQYAEVLIDELSGILERARERTAARMRSAVHP
jgi:hypothetical protein